MKLLLFLLLTGVLTSSCATKVEPAPQDRGTAQQYQMPISAAINQYRQQHGLSPVKESIHLVNVAENHIADLQTNRPDQGKCNMNSWSNKGNWKPCCYTDDHAQAACMWYKPKELSKGAFDRTGYEIVAYFSGTMDTDKAMQEWIANPSNRDIMLNREKWAEKKWEYMGGAISKNYAAAWFSEKSK